jgi:hypothetical protein
MGKPEFIQDVKDGKGNLHSVLIYGQGDLRIGNKKFKSMTSVKIYLGVKPLFGESTLLYCLECDHRFRRVIKVSTVYIKCPKCGGYDTELD